MTGLRILAGAVSSSVLNETRPAVEQLPHFRFLGRIPLVSIPLSR